jgi:hypothetical protein
MIPTSSCLRYLLVLVALHSLPMATCLRRRQSPFAATSSSSCLLCRGGQSRDPYNGYPDNSDYNAPPPPPNDADHIFQETVQDRVDKWRSDQIKRRDHMSEEQEASLRDSQGRLKLMATVGKGSRAFIFFMLMWRDIHLFEVSDKSLKGIIRYFAVVPLTVLFLANLAGVVAALSAGGGQNMDKMVEIVLLFWYFLRLTILPSKYVPREIFVASVLHSVFFIIQAQSFTRITW